MKDYLKKKGYSSVSKATFAWLLIAGLAFPGLASIAHAADLPAKVVSTAPAPVPFFLFSDTVLEYRFESQATEPGSSKKFPKQIANITHVDAWQYGTNFASVDVLQSTNADPVNGAPQFSGQGSRELYAIYRGTLSGNAVTGTKVFAFGKVIKDISLEFGGDLEEHNNSFSAQISACVIGPNFAFNTQGIFNIGVHFYKEMNHNAIAPLLGIPSHPGYDAANGDVSFRPTAEFEVVYLQPLTFTKLPLSFTGFANVILPKGKDGFNNNTKTEFLTGNRLVLDVGKILFDKSKRVDAFVGYKFWYNKFGNTASYGNPAYTPGSYENQFICGLDVHLQ